MDGKKGEREQRGRRGVTGMGAGKLFLLKKRSLAGRRMSTTPLPFARRIPAPPLPPRIRLPRPPLPSPAHYHGGAPLHLLRDNQPPHRPHTTTNDPTHPIPPPLPGLVPVSLSSLLLFFFLSVVLARPVAAKARAVAVARSHSRSLSLSTAGLLSTPSPLSFSPLHPLSVPR